MNYATHTMVPGTSELVASIVLELMVDRSQGGTIHRQWTQPKGSVMVTGIFTHVYPVLRSYDAGFVGWYRLHSSVYTNLHAGAIQDEFEISSGSDMD